MDEERDYEAALVGALLFLENEPISQGKIAHISGLSEEHVELALQRLCTEFEKPIHGFCL